MSEQEKSERPVGRPALTPEQKTQKEPTVDTHLNIPVSIVEKIDKLRKAGESRKDFIVRVLREYEEI